MKIEKILAIDYGTVRVGLAVSRHTLAEPLKIIANNAQMFAEIAEICVAEEIEKIIVGISENEMAKKTRVFITDLKNFLVEERRLELPIEEIDETLSSQTVHKKLKTAKKSKRMGHIDHLAAAEFLQDWLDQHY